MSNLTHLVEECPYCSAEFSVVTDDNVEAIYCPFCGEELFDDDEDDWDDEDEELEDD